MKRWVKVLCIIIALILAFILGWRVMPRVWPGIKEAIVYPIFPQLKPAPKEAEPYIPKSNTAFGDPIHATDSVIYYFYKDYCPYCRELTPLMEGLPDQITLPDGTPSKVRLICLNKVEEEILEIITDYYATYDVPEEEQYVPAVAIGDRYLFLGVEIIDQLMDALVNGEGLDTPLLDGNERIQ